MSKQKIGLIITHSLQKIFPGSTDIPDRREASCFENEAVSFQLAFINEGLPLEDCRLVIGSDLPCEVRRVGYVPGEFCDHPEGDDYVIAKGLHLFPDPLLPFDGSPFPLKGACVNAFWVTVGDQSKPVGKHTIHISLLDREENELAAGEFTLFVNEGVLPELPIPVTDWMHYDGICNFYGVSHSL